MRGGSIDASGFEPSHGGRNGHRERMPLSGVEGSRLRTHGQNKKASLERNLAARWLPLPAGRSEVVSHMSFVRWSSPERRTKRR